MTLYQHGYDVIVRSLKTGLAVYAAFIAAGGLNVVHLTPTVQFDLAYLSVLATALLNIGLKVHTAVTASINAPVAEKVGVVPEAPLNGVEQLTQPVVTTTGVPPVTSPTAAPSS